MADMTGQNQEMNEDWQRRIELVKADNFQCIIHYNFEVSTNITEEERDRLQWRLKLVQDYACAMAAGMLKGVIKYPVDLDNPNLMMESMVGEHADATNYMILNVENLSRRGKI